MTLDYLSEEYVKITLAIGLHHEYYIDAFYGPKEWIPSKKEDLETLEIKTDVLIENIKSSSDKEDEKLRKDFLLIHAKSVKTFVSQLRGTVLSFDEESQSLYDAVSPKLDEKVLNSHLEELNKIIPGSGDLSKRMTSFMQDFIIPRDKLDVVFSAAINESRKVTKKYIPLAENENFEIQYVSDQVWSAYNWYKGNNYSVIELNTDFPLQINRAIDLAAHEAYPGHHVFNSLMEKHLVNEKKWMEYSVYTLYSPLSLLAEGSANYGIELAFPKETRLDYEINVLFPLAGLDSSKAKLYYEIQDLMKNLSYAGNKVAQEYLDKKISKEKAIEDLMKYSLTSKEKATQRLAFIEANRSYVINYNLGEDLVRSYVENKANTYDEKWAVFTQLLKNPKTASMMKENKYD